MNELTKTAIFVILAIVTVAGAVIGRPGRVGVEAPDQIGKVLFEEFQDPSLAQNLRIASFNEDTGNVREFSVSKKQGEWVIPSHEDYPADATENLKIAANLFVGMKVIDVAGDRNQDHVTYGVIEPDPDATDLASEGVGKLISLKDDKGNRLAELIVGKEVKGKEGQRYARIPKQDRVYALDIDPSKLSTEFGDWIVQDVMNINSIDIERMIIRDYLATPVLKGRQLAVSKEQRSQIAVSWNADEFKWDLDELSQLREGELRPSQMLDGEELNKKRLDEMKNALASLTIVDVAPKPPILREGLREGVSDIFKDQEGVTSLLTRGFLPEVTAERTINLVSTDGEVTIITKDGIDVTLRFGGPAGGGAGAEANQMNRFVMITATVNESSFPPPELEDMPGDAEAKTETSAAEGEEDGTAAEAEKPVDEERDRIAKENQRKLDEFNDKRKKAQDRVSDLNLRFADWYYVISDEVFKDVRLSRSDVIKASAGSSEKGSGIDSFRQLENEGLVPTEKKAPPPGI